ncbi:MAG TPA: hypothetical protein VMV79_02320, partial [Alphaproteobacteria bacterium]|nr:hypothetical protein [Alphaproteobacteria bacterium]
MKDPEVEAINAINAALTAVEDPEIRVRVLRWANDKFAFVPKIEKVATAKSPVSAQSDVSVSGNEIPGIAVLSENGNFRLTVRDLKAKSANDAAVRLAHVTIRAYQQLSGQKTVSSKQILLPALTQYRVYDGNTRAALAREKGIIRKGDELELDHHAQHDADRFMREIADESVTGKWVPKGRT